MNKYYSITYKLFTVKDGVREMVEETTANDPFVFISGFGTTIPGFEGEIEKLSKGDNFNFTVPSSEAYGEYVAERVIELPRPEDESQFNLSVGAVVPLQNEDGTRFMGHIVAVEADKVRIDLNHPLAGCDLNFQGTVTECREATNEEITQMITQLSGGGCGGCGGGGCSGGCGNCGDGGCGGEGGCGNCGK